MTDPTRVLIADDHPIVVEGLRAVLSTLPDMTLVSAVATGREAIRVATAEHPDVVVMDLRMPDVTGIEATRQILARHPDVAVLVLTMYDDDEWLFAAVRAGARGYLVKGVPNDAIVRALRSVAAGEAVFGPTVAQRVLDYFTTGAPAAEEPLPELSDREREILTLLAAGHGTNDIARRLYLSPKTVRNHVSGILHKLHVTDRAQAIVLAREAGLGPGRAAGDDRDRSAAAGYDR
jgi:DNA-binding NarL/FixJ family response regulator